MSQKDPNGTLNTLNQELRKASGRAFAGKMSGLWKGCPDEDVQRFFSGTA
jgi:hypothetical protein